MPRPSRHRPFTAQKSLLLLVLTLTALVLRAMQVAP